VVEAHDLHEILDRLAGLGDVTGRALFGGHGLYWRETIFGILFRNRLYLKADDHSKADFVSRGMGPFRPNDRQTLKSYHEVPAGFGADPKALLSWVREATWAAQPSNPAP
jgi:DNA transformation protein